MAADMMPIRCDAAAEEASEDVVDGNCERRVKKRENRIVS
jgi:hypothetical protein